MKKYISFLLAAVLMVTCASMGASAYTVDAGISFVDSGKYAVCDGDGTGIFYSSKFDITIDNDYSGGSSKITADWLWLGDTYYFQINEDTPSTDGSIYVPTDELTNGDYFTFKVDKDQNSSYVDSVKLVSKSYSGSRRHYIAVKLKDSSITEEKHVTFDVYFKARKNSDSHSKVTGTWSNGDIINARFSLYVKNDEDDSGDADIEAGKNVVFKPIANDDNTITWGDSNNEIACLEFKATDDADDFYAKLSTKVNNTVYEKYGDPVNADLFFRTFSGSSIDSTSRAKLTLYNPWYDDDRNSPDPRDIYIYSRDGNTLTDITHQFTYVDEDDTPDGLDGWQISTRTLGAYVISDVKLPLSGYDRDDEDLPAPDEIVKPNDNATPSIPLEVPSTGDADFTALAVLCGVASIAAAAVSLKKKKKNGK